MMHLKQNYEITQAPVNIDQLMSEIQSDSKIVVEANETGKTLPELTAATEEPPEEKGFFKRIINKIRPPRVTPMEQFHVSLRRLVVHRMIC